MSRDYKPRARGKTGTKRSASRGGTLIGLFIGLVLGVIFALGVAWYINRTPIPFMSGKNGKPATETPAEAEKSAKHANTPATGQPAALPGKPGDKPLEQPRFDFYKILPEGEKAPTKPEPVKPADAAADVPEKLYLQLAAFQNPADADNLKAKVALMGLEASVQKVDTPDKGTLHRVRVGPYTATAEMESVKAQLAQNGITATLVKVKPKPANAPVAGAGTKP